MFCLFGWKICCSVTILPRGKYKNWLKHIQDERWLFETDVNSCHKTQSIDPSWSLQYSVSGDHVLNTAATRSHVPPLRKAVINPRNIHLHVYWINDWASITSVIPYQPVTAFIKSCLQNWNVCAINLGLYNTQGQKTNTVVIFWRIINLQH